MFNFKKKDATNTQQLIDNVASEKTTEQLKIEVVEAKHKKLTTKVIEQEIIIRRLLELVIMNIEHKAYDKMRPKIDAIKNLLDKK